MLALLSRLRKSYLQEFRSQGDVGLRQRGNALPPARPPAEEAYRVRPDLKKSAACYLDQLGLARGCAPHDDKSSRLFMTKVQDFGRMLPLTDGWRRTIPRAKHMGDRWSMSMFRYIKAEGYGL
jgi:hypothetical protein